MREKLGEEKYVRDKYEGNVRGKYVIEKYEGKITRKKNLEDK